MKTMLLATGQTKLDTIIANKIAPETGYDVIGTVGYKNELLKQVKAKNPQLVIVSKLLSGTDVTLLETVLTVKRECPNVRIIYLAGEVDDKNKEKFNELATLVLSGIYDILHEKTITVQLLTYLINNPKDREQVQYLLKYMKANVVYDDEIVDIEEEEEVEDIEENGYKNVFVVSSIKPGTGKSFVSTNLATAIAKYGVKKEDGKPPRVALIEADLQNLSVGTLLQIEDDSLNLKSVMQKISTIITDEGKLIDDVVKIEAVNSYIKSCFKPYYHVKNLFALVGSQLTMAEVENIKPFHYVYLIDAILDDFDVIIIDSNSSLAHVTTYPLLRMCNTAYYVLNLDFNNVRNNSKYQETLSEIEVFDKVKYILNEDIDKEYRQLIGRDLLEDLIFKADEIKESGFDTVAQIPEIPKEIFLNRLYEGKPVVLDDTEYTLKARIEISKIANEIWDIDNFEWLNAEYEKYRSRVFNSVGNKRKGLFR